MKIGPYTKDAVKIVGTCKFYLVHPDTKKLHSLLVRMMEVYCYHVQLPLHLDLYNQEQD